MFIYLGQVPKATNKKEREKKKDLYKQFSREQTHRYMILIDHDIK